MVLLGNEGNGLQAAIKSAVRIISDSENRKKVLKEAEGKVREIAKRHEETLKEAGLAAGLYSLVRGDKTRVTLERYVLGALLDEVTRAANLRLLDMSHHRYSLHRMADGSTDAKGVSPWKSRTAIREDPAPPIPSPAAKHSWLPSHWHWVLPTWSRPGREE